MNISLTLLGQLISFLFFSISFILGPLIVNRLAKERGEHAMINTVLAIFLSVAMPLVLFQIYWLVKKDIVPESQDTL